jgi:hypothetical protein
MYEKLLLRKVTSPMPTRARVPPKPCNKQQQRNRNLTLVKASVQYKINVGKGERAVQSQRWQRRACSKARHQTSSHTCLGLPEPYSIYLYGYIRYFWPGNHHIYGHIRCTYVHGSGQSYTHVRAPFNVPAYQPGGWFVIVSQFICSSKHAAGGYAV